MSGDAPIEIATEELQAVEIADAISEASTPQDVKNATKMAEDFFSGSPENNIRRFQLINEALAGIGHSALSLPERKGKEERASKANRRHVEAVLHAAQRSAEQKNAHPSTASAYQNLALLIDAIQKSNLSPEQKQEWTKATQKAEEYLNNLSNDKKSLDTQRQAYVDNVMNTGEYLKEHFGGTVSDNFDTFIALEKELITVKLDTPGDSENETNYCRHIVYKDEHGYYTTDQNGEDIRIEDPDLIRLIETQEQKGQSFGNAASEEAVQEYNFVSEELSLIFNFDKNQNGDDHKHAENISHFNDHIDGIIEADAKRFELDTLIEELETLVQNAKTQIEQNDPNLSAQDFEKSVGEIEAKRIQVQQKFKEIQLHQNELTSSYETLLEKIQALEDQKTLNKQKLESELFELTETQDNLDDLKEQLRTFSGNRHEQLQAAFDNTITDTWFGDWLKDTALGIGLVELGINEDLLEAWKNPIQHNGQDVFRDNKTGELYSFDEATGTRDAITDPEILLSLYKQANTPDENGHVKLFANETPYGKDPNNSYEETANAMLDKDVRAKHMEYLEEQIIKPIEDNINELDEKIAKIDQQIAEHKAEHGIEDTEPKLSARACFGKAATSLRETHEKEHDSDFAQNSADICETDPASIPTASTAPKTDIGLQQGA